MIREKLLTHLRSIEWDTFKVKKARSKLPKNIWETVGAFANTSGGWIVLGIAETNINEQLLRYAKLAENAGYGINKVLSWQKLTGEEVIFDSNLTRTTVAYVRNMEDAEPQNEPQNAITTRQRHLLNLIASIPYLTKREMAQQLEISEATIQRDLTALRAYYSILWQGSSKQGKWEIKDKK